MLQTDYFQESSLVFNADCAFNMCCIFIFTHFQPVSRFFRLHDTFLPSQLRNRQEINVKEIFEHRPGAGRVLQQLRGIYRVVFICVSLLRNVISFMLHKHTEYLS